MFLRFERHVLDHRRDANPTEGVRNIAVDLVRGGGRSPRAARVLQDRRLREVPLALGMVALTTITLLLSSRVSTPVIRAAAARLHIPVQ
jgi:hypothetical protein